MSTSSHLQGTALNLLWPYSHLRYTDRIRSRDQVQVLQFCNRNDQLLPIRSSHQTRLRSACSPETTPQSTAPIVSSLLKTFKSNLSCLSAALQMFPEADRNRLELAGRRREPLLSSCQSK